MTEAVAAIRWDQDREFCRWRRDRMDVAKQVLQSAQKAAAQAREASGAAARAGSDAADSVRYKHWQQGYSDAAAVVVHPLVRAACDAAFTASKSWHVAADQAAMAWANWTAIADTSIVRDWVFPPISEGGPYTTNTYTESALADEYALQVQYLGDLRAREN